MPRPRRDDQCHESTNNSRGESHESGNNRRGESHGSGNNRRGERSVPVAHGSIRDELPGYAIPSPCEVTSAYTFGKEKRSYLHQRNR